MGWRWRMWGNVSAPSGQPFAKRAKGWRPRIKNEIEADARVFGRPMAYWQRLPIGVGWLLDWATEGAFVMPTRNVNLTRELDRFVAKKIKTGRYENASEVVRAGLRTLEREEQQHEAKLAALRAAIDEGDASGIASGNVFRRARKRLKLPGSSL